MSDEEKSEKQIRIKGGYQPLEKGYQPTKDGSEYGYQPTQGNIEISMDILNPPQGGSGVPQSSSSSNEKPAKEE